MNPAADRLALWPIFAAVIGIGFPVLALLSVDGWLKYLRVWEVVVPYATALVFFGFLLAVLLGLVRILASAFCRLAPTFPKAAINALVLALARAVALFAMVYLGIRWFEAVSGDDVILQGAARLLVVVSIVALAVGCTVAARSPGPLLIVGRRIAGASMVLSLLVVAGTAAWSAVQSAPRTAPAAADKARHADVILISIDTLSAPHMSLYGHERPTSPRLDELATQGAVVFDRFYANSNFTTPGIASMLTGTRPWVHRALHLPSRPIPFDGQSNFVEEFHDAGYRTMAVDTNVVAASAFHRLLPWLDAYAGLRIQKSDAFVERLVPWFPGLIEMSNGFTPYQKIMAQVDRLVVRAGWFGENTHYLPELVFGEARAFWARSDEAPRFMWVHLYPPHAPYATPAPWLGMFDADGAARSRFDSNPGFMFAATADPQFPQRYVGRYHESIAYIDHHVGEFLDWLKARGEFDNSVIVITSDHGESFARDYGQHCGPLLTEELIRIPLLVKPAKASVGGHRVRQPAEHQDLAPTLLELAGLPAEPGFQGRSLAKLLAPGRDVDSRLPQAPVFSMNFERSDRYAALDRGSVALILGRNKFVHYFGLDSIADIPKLEDELYDLIDDPREQRNLVATNSTLAASMREHIRRELERHGRATD